MSLMSIALPFGASRDLKQPFRVLASPICKWSNTPAYDSACHDLPYCNRIVCCAHIFRKRSLKDGNCMAAGSVLDPKNRRVYKETSRSTRSLHLTSSFGGKWPSLQVQLCEVPSNWTGVEGFSCGFGRQEQHHEPDLLLGQNFLDPVMCWDNRIGKESSRGPDLCRNGSGEVLWSNSMCKSGWVDDQLISMDMHVDHGDSPCKWRSPNKPGPGRYEVLNMGVLTAVTVRTSCQQGKLTEAVEALESLARTKRLIPHSVFYIVLKLCATKKDLVMGRRVHELAVKLGYDSSPYLANHILRMYACAGRLEDAMDVFARVGEPDAFMWFSIISAHAKHGKPKQAIQLYHEMRSSGVKADAHVFVATLQACAFASDVESGRKVHCDVLHSGIPPNLFVGNCLVDMYAKCGKLEEAHRVFDSLATKDVVTWNALIAGYADKGNGQTALVLYGQMQQEGLIVGSHVTFVCLLKACASAGALQRGMQLHSQLVERGEADNILVSTCLVDMYAKCGEFKDALRVFQSLATKNVVTWTALIAGYASRGLYQEALVLYEQMEQDGLIVGNHVTFACLLKACASAGAGALQTGRQLHSRIVERGQLDNILVGNCLVDMYAKCGALEDAHKVFVSLTAKDVVTWNSLIAGYADYGLGEKAIVLYRQMEEEGLIVADEVTFACLLKACGNAGALQKGRELHSQIVERGQQDNIVLGNCLVDMYAKCGELEAARQVFNSLATKDVVTWNALIGGCGTCDEGHNAISCFEEMLVAGIQPNDATFTCLLAACSHEGLVKEGCQYYNSMLFQHGITPCIEHYNCMIDLLGRAGHLDEAENMLLSSESQSNVVGLTSLLNACKSHGDVERARRCFESLVRLEPQSASAYVLMANAYADAGRWADVDRIETQRMVAGAYKKPAVAGIEVKKKVHTFVVGENHRDEITRKVHSMNARMKQESGHAPHTKLVMKPLNEKEKEDVLCGHAEKLALAFGLLNTPSGTPLVVTKNLRMCSDCHSSTEIMSRVEKRGIVVRDGYRVHRFAGGRCSCNSRP